jgi:hypothetical protein
MKYHDVSQGISQSNIFFSKEISPDLLNSTDFFQSSDGTLELKKGIWQIPFEFTIPIDALESYNGKHAWINNKERFEIQPIDHLSREGLKILTIPDK